MKKVKSSFKGKVMGASERKAKEAFSYGYLNLPKGVPVFLPVPGKTVTLDFLPYEVTMKNHPDRYDEEEIAVPGTLWYRLPFKAHRNIGTKKDSVVCLQSFGKKCPVCEYRAKRQKEGADKDETGALRPSDRYLYIVNPLDSDKFEAGKLHIFDISHAMFQKLLDEEYKEESIPEDFMDPFEGVSLKIRFSSETIGTSRPFAEAKKITAVERKKQYKEAILDTVPKLDELLVVMTYDELERKFFELDEEDEQEPETKPSKKQKEEDDEPPVTSRKKKQTEPEPEPDPEMTWDELELLDEKKLIKYIKANDLDTDPDDFEDDEDGLRKAIAEELDIEVPKKTKTPKKEAISKADRCPVCKGTGKDAKGKMCKVCMGTGVKQNEPEADDDPPVDKKKSGKASKSEDECPSGHEFGVDTDKEDECDECKLWDACMAAKKANKKK